MDESKLKADKGTVLRIVAKVLEDGKCYIVFTKAFNDGIDDVKYEISNKFLESWS